MRKLLFLGVLAASTVFFNSCQKEDLLGSDFSSSKTTTSSTSSSDGIDRHGPRPTPIDISQLPSSITDYVTANYAGGTIAHAGTLPNGNYAIVVENTDGTKVALLFDASGNFVQVLPPPPNGGNGGPGGGGNHPHPTPIDVSQLPSSITDYVTANYAEGTIAHAGTLSNGNYAIVVENTDGTKVALLFDASGNFVQVLPPPPNGGPGGGGNHPHPTPIDVSQLPSSITDYVTANYAGGTIAHAGTLPNGNYAIVVENTDGTKVALLFDASGNFVQVLPPPPIGG